MPVQAERPMMIAVRRDHIVRILKSTRGEKAWFVRFPSDRRGGSAAGDVGNRGIRTLGGIKAYGECPSSIDLFFPKASRCETTHLPRPWPLTR